ncbi:cation-translocating P-type ATPase [Pontibacter sp. Tf4]|uniref:cation-translocating P-type ATPase n=1 Tax=Pontibacter sp. Tf4 TaxID=2761620 RepID=UPI0016256FB3|nr:cation-translocating P-type ATPase [Pontibacter sp. Tf4]MBB6610892.1 cation-translocating P-type ATPase [Pontibacter sp. Tf4]
MDNWHTRTTEEVLRELTSSSANGLTSTDAEERLQQYGYNELEERGGKSALRMLWEQFTQTMVLILIVAAVISGFLGKEVETIAIVAIVVLFAVLGFVQEFRAEKAMAALKSMVVPTVRVRRDGAVKEISAKELVPGDVVLLEAGNVIPADMRILESANLRVQEAALTGESEAVEKSTEALPSPEMPLGDRTNMLYLGTNVAYGRGAAAVVETGMKTELGKIANLLQDVGDKQTPLQKKLDQLGKILAILGFAAAALMLVIGVLGGEELDEMFLTAVSLAVAVVPEGLPAVVTITLAIGAQRMLKRHALMRKLPAVETLGAVTIICSDKTGTLTENRMTVTTIGLPDELIDFKPEHAETIDVPHKAALALTIGMLCNDSVLKTGTEESLQVIGDPTEGALLLAAQQAGYRKEELEQQLPRVHEEPFDSTRKRMTTVHQITPEATKLAALRNVKSDNNYIACTKGAVDSLLKITTNVWVDGAPERITAEWHEQLLEINNQMAQNGMRVLGLAFRELQEPHNNGNALEEDLTFVGMMGIIDPPRAAVKAAVATCRTAGIRPIMITGDHPLTAAAIARELNITQSSEAVTGEMLNKFSEDELADVIARVSIFARVSPEDKLRIVEMLQKKGEVVAMTGDGVNDSPALKTANIGVAMGITGTDVAKEASDMVLLDDNFATIVAAVEEGRVIYDNLLRFIKFSLGGNLGKVLTMLCAPLIGITVALSPLQLLWLNLLTDGLMGLGLGTEPAEADTMKRPPRAPDQSVLTKTEVIYVSWTGTVIAIVTLLIGSYYLSAGNEQSTAWQTMIFATIGFMQMGNAFGLRAYGYSPLSIRSNKLFFIMATLTLILQLAVIYVPGVNNIFDLQPLEIKDLAIAFGTGILMFALVFLENTFNRKSRKETTIA